jgi:hypothetical protein
MGRKNGDDEIQNEDPHQFYNQEEFETFTSDELLLMRDHINHILEVRAAECEQLLSKLKPKKKRTRTKKAD